MIIVDFIRDGIILLLQGENSKSKEDRRKKAHTSDGDTSPFEFLRHLFDARSSDSVFHVAISFLSPEEYLACTGCSLQFLLQKEQAAFS